MNLHLLDLHPSVVDTNLHLRWLYIASIALLEAFSPSPSTVIFVRCFAGISGVIVIWTLNLSHMRLTNCPLRPIILPVAPTGMRSCVVLLVFLAGGWLFEIVVGVSLGVVEGATWVRGPLLSEFCLSFDVLHVASSSLLFVLSACGWLGIVFSWFLICSVMCIVGSVGGSLGVGCCWRLGTVLLVFVEGVIAA